MARVARRVLRPDALNVSSPAWAWYVNTLGASSLLRGRERRDVYLEAGMDIRSDRIGPACYLHTSMLRVGEGTLINHGCHIENVAPVEIGERAALAMQVLISTSHHEIGGPNQRAKDWMPRPVRIGSGSWVGARAVILPGITIGEGCLIAAGAVVTEDCAAQGLYAGVPARRIRDLPS